MLKQIISGGQTGVDRAALDAALLCEVAIGGWCPRGRRAEDGPISERYALQETESRAYDVRTRLNVQESDGTLILHSGPLTGGTALTAKLARQQDKPLCCIDLLDAETTTARQQLTQWLQEHDIQVLNVAGPRESTTPAIYEGALDFLAEYLRSQS